MIFLLFEWVLNLSCTFSRQYTKLPKYYVRVQTAVLGPWLACPPASGLSYWRSSQTVTVISVQFPSNWSRTSMYICKAETLAFTNCDYCWILVSLLACLLIVLGLGTGRPGKFTRNLRGVSEHDFLLFIYVLWIYTRSHNENSCLGMSQIAIITIATLTALTSNNNHNQ